MEGKNLVFKMKLGSLFYKSCYHTTILYHFVKKFHIMEVKEEEKCLEENVIV
ncbi:MAG: hypothetical protein HFJ33_06620 [Clostridia bacterium]|nr:hypothetical protein [Clostridia bacterium]